MASPAATVPATIPASLGPAFAPAPAQSPAFIPTGAPSSLPPSVPRPQPMFRPPPPLVPIRQPMSTVTAPFTSAIPTVLPSEPSARLFAVDEAAGIVPGAYLGPNWVYQCGNGGNKECYTESFNPLDADLDASCVAQSARCVDAVTRGLLSGLQPILAPSETLFPEETRVILE